MKKDYCAQNVGHCNAIMKRIFIIILIFICGCETTRTTSTIQSTFKEPLKTVRNPKCEDIKSFKVFQVLDNSALATVCRDSDNEYCLGHAVVFQKEKEKIYFDDQIIKVKNNECAIYIETYKYPTKDGYKTVPIVKIIDSQITNPE